MIKEKRKEGKKGEKKKVDRTEDEEEQACWSERETMRQSQVCSNLILLCVGNNLTQYFPLRRKRIFYI